MASYSQQRTDLKSVSVWQWDVLLSLLLLSVCFWPVYLLLYCLLFSSLVSFSCLLSSPLLSLLISFLLFWFLIVSPRFHPFFFFFCLYSSSDFLLKLVVFGSPLWFLSVLIGSVGPVLSAAACLWCTGTAGSQSERSQSGAGGQHPAGERCSEDKPSCSRTGNEPREHHPEGSYPKCSVEPHCHQMPGIPEERYIEPEHCVSGDQNR